MKWTLLHVNGEETCRISSDFERGLVIKFHKVFQINIMGQLIRDWPSEYKELERAILAFK